MSPLLAVWLLLLRPQQHVVRLETEQPSQEGLLVIGQGCVPLTLGFQLVLKGAEVLPSDNPCRDTREERSLSPREAPDYR